MQVGFLMAFWQVASDQSHPPAHRVQRGSAPQSRPAMWQRTAPLRTLHLTSVQNVVDVFQEGPKTRGNAAMDTRNVRTKMHEGRGILCRLLPLTNALLQRVFRLFPPPSVLLSVRFFTRLCQNTYPLHASCIYVCTCMCTCVFVHVCACAAVDV